MKQLPATILRAIEPEDLDLLYEIENDKNLWDVGTTNVPYSRYTLRNYIAHSSSDIYTDRQMRLMIENAEGCVVGIADVVCFDPKNNRAELGLVIISHYRRQGYATSALAQVTDYARRILHLHQLYAYIDTRNEASLQLFRKIGFRESATLSEWLFDGTKYYDAVLMQTFF